MPYDIVDAYRDVQVLYSVLAEKGLIEQPKEEEPEEAKEEEEDSALAAEEPAKKKKKMGRKTKF